MSELRASEACMERAGHDPVWTKESLEAPHGVADKSDRVRRMFDAIAPTYERVNKVCSVGRDAAWRRRAVASANVLPTDRVLDVACGTGDFAEAFRAAGAAQVIGCDFSPEMLNRAARRSEPNLRWCECDALCLPFGPANFDIVSCAFGVRNFQDLTAGLSEMFRVLRDGGRAVILEFTRPPPGLIRRVYELYADRIMPPIASWLSGDREGAYRYLPRSVRFFLSAPEMVDRLERVGFSHVRATSLSMGVVTVYTAVRPPAGESIGPMQRG